MTVTRKTKAERLELLKQQKADLEQTLKAKAQKLAARIKAIEAKNTTQSRKIDTRRKILLGAMIMDRLEHEEISNEWIGERMDKFLVRDDDRVLFGLERKKSVVTKTNSDQVINSAETDLTDLNNQSDLKYDLWIEGIKYDSDKKNLIDLMTTKGDLRREDIEEILNTLPQLLTMNLDLKDAEVENVEFMNAGAVSSLVPHVQLEI